MPQSIGFQSTTLKTDRRRAMGAARLLVGIIASYCAFPAAAGMFDRVPVEIEYQEAYVVYYQRNYSDAASACASVSSQRNAWIDAHPNAAPNQRTKWLNPRATVHPTYGLGCTVDIYWVVAEPPCCQAGHTQPNQFMTTIQTAERCPTGYSKGTFFGPPNYSYCYIVPQLNRECGAKNCPNAGKPAIVSAGIEILSETDHAKRSSSDLEFTRYYRSSPPSRHHGKAS